ncbi:MAG: beta-galactosidase [Rikenellaceae bacterium]|nr:beta-galactosidase [Rikenellaceae bacterium]
MKKLWLLLLLVMPFALSAQDTEQLFITGKGLGDTQTWEFFCTDGMNSNKWTTIQVPSQWELEGFGEYIYGRWYVDDKSRKEPPKEQGFYRRTFDVPADWNGKQVKIVFEGVMTDTEVKINGELAGPIHQGGFNEFSYDITDKLKYGSQNLIEVNVSKESANRLVNAAERKADWWIFGGIYRPVYLEAKPAVNIDRIAVDAASDGGLYAEIYTTPLESGYTLEASIKPVNKNNRSSFKSQKVNLSSGGKHTVNVKWNNVNTWDVENPNLYYLTLELKDSKGKTVHTYTERIGFRTIDFRPRDGIYVNGKKIVMKGINRHSFHPDGGRTTNAEISLMDGQLIKEMNMNAVRFHYAPDKHFLDVCDSLGIFVVNELAGWQNAYDTEVGTKLLNELIARDVNHPSIVIWSNGNEGGWNYNLDHLFAELDPQKRHVIHSWADWNDLDTHHYPAYQTGVARFTNGFKLFMPTEFMHGTYDQGHGAGLEDFWNKYTDHPLFVGGFMWDFSDNAVKRVDKNNILDSDGSNGADGILGPYREKEGSYYTVREVWAPIQFEQLFVTPSFDGKFIVKNTYLYTNLNECRMEFKVLTAPSPLSGGKTEVIASGNVVLPAIDPKEVGTAKMNVPVNFFDGDILEIKAWDKHGEEICTWTWPIHYADEYTEKQIAQVAQNGKAQFVSSDNSVTLTANGVNVTFNTEDGLLKEVKNQNGIVSFNNGPIPVGMNARLDKTIAYTDGDNAVFTVYYKGAIDSIQWKMTPSGIMSMRSVMLNKANGGQGFDDAVTEDNIINFGLTFSYPEEKVEGMEWFGRGPYRVWKNRIKGTNYGIWEKTYNNTMTGASYETLVYPEFKGYHGNFYWGTLQTTESPFTVYSESDGVFFRVFTPEEPTDNKSNKANPAFPKGDITFLYDIPAIRCFKPVSQHGPQSQPGNIRIKLGDEGIQMNLWFDFR